MDVDESQNDTQVQQNGQEAALEAQLARLEQLEASPYDYELHVANIKAASSADEKDDARKLMSNVLPLSEELWLDWIRDRKQAAQIARSIDAYMAVIEIYTRACADYLSVKIHHDYAEYIVSLYFEARGLPYPEGVLDTQAVPDPSKADPVATGVFDEAFVHGELENVINTKIRCHISEGQRVWRVLHDFELGLLQRDRSAERVPGMHLVYLKRLADPHLQLSETHQLFSTFVTNYLDDYEANMIAVQKTYSSTQKLVSERESHEHKLTENGSSLSEFKRYLAWELEVKKPNAPLVRTLYERSLFLFPSDAELWQDYLDFELSKVKHFKGDTNAERENVILTLSERAVRNLPGSGVIAAESMRAVEFAVPARNAETFIKEQSNRAMTSNAFTSGTDLAEVIIAHADYLRHSHEVEGTVEIPSSEVRDVLRAGVNRLRQLGEAGTDPQYRVHKYLLRQLEKDDSQEAIEQCFASWCKGNTDASYLLQLRAEYYTRNGNIESARKVYSTYARKKLDFKEYFLGCWVSFEHQDGSLATLLKAMNTVKHEMKFVKARNEKQARLAMSAAAMTATNGDNQATLQSTNVADRPAKRHAPDNEAGEEARAAKKQKSETPDEISAPKRDRENATVFVSQLPLDTDAQALQRLFRDCGTIREIKVRQVGEETLATVEFQTKVPAGNIAIQRASLSLKQESIAAALTKDKKRIANREINVFPDWQSTLYVTNFPENFDATDLTSLFQPYGPIFEVRWPSKRLKATRRFAYVQFTTQDAARSSLILHNIEIPEGSGRRLQVKLSDPSRKQSRTDAEANKREIYVTGLPRYAKEEDVRKLFEKVAGIKAVRLGMDSDGSCKGFAFIDFNTEDAAQEALGMNNVEYKKRRLAVVLADSRVTAKLKQPESGQGRRADAANRSVHVRGLPQEAPEPLVQQFFEKHGPVSSVEILAPGVAVVTFADAKDAAKLLLEVEPVVYEGCKLILRDQLARKSANTGRRGARLGLGHPRPRAAVPEAHNDGPGQTSEPRHSDPSTPAAPAQRSQADFRALLGKK